MYFGGNWLSADGSLKNQKQKRKKGTQTDGQFGQSRRAVLGAES